MTPTDLADLIRHRRKSTGLSVRALAFRCTVPDETIRNWERGANLDGHADFLTVLEALGIEVRLTRVTLNRGIDS